MPASAVVTLTSTGLRPASRGLSAAMTPGSRPVTRPVTRVRRLATRVKTEWRMEMSWGRTPRTVTRPVTLVKTTSRRVVRTTRTRSTSPSATGMPALPVTWVMIFLRDCSTLASSSSAWGWASSWERSPDSTWSLRASVRNGLVWGL
ncbi:hypothetical protein IMZ48_32330 [Candidatus Bathyarchaeota archaeon]|nr:hypothetical protein [Candidatus Bathyarchaeota archaeon]